jgi:hypothetical protein
LSAGDVSASCKNCYLYCGGGFGFEFETQSYLDSIDLGFTRIPLNLKIPSGSLLYMKVWVDLLLTSSVNVDVVSGSARAASDAAAEPTYTFSIDLRRSVSSPADVDIKSSQWSSLKPILDEDLVFEVCPPPPPRKRASPLPVLRSLRSENGFRSGREGTHAPLRKRPANAGNFT